MNWDLSHYTPPSGKTGFECVDKNQLIDGFYPAEKTFEKCQIDQCSFCAPTDPTRLCFKCKDNNNPSSALIVYKAFRPNTCLTECREDLKRYLDGSGHCLDCPASLDCETCDKDGCKSCSAGYHPTHTSKASPRVCVQCAGQKEFIDENGYCQDCSENCERCNKDGCQQCKTRYGLKENNPMECVECPLNCLECQNPSTCSVCQAGYIVLKGSSPNICVNDCEQRQGRLISSENGKQVCDSCLEGCVECQEKSKCLKCSKIEGLYLQPGDDRCLATCPQQYSKDNDLQRCIFCPKTVS